MCSGKLAQCPALGLKPKPINKSHPAAFGEQATGGPKTSNVPVDRPQPSTGRAKHGAQGPPAAPWDTGADR